MIKQKIIVNKGKYVICVLSKKPKSAFAIIEDGLEITAIVNQTGFDIKKAVKFDKNWKILTFDFVMPLSLVGFSAKISSEMAKHKINILWIGAFSTDHLLIKIENLTKAKKVLRQLGYVINEIK